MTSSSGLEKVHDAIEALLEYACQQELIEQDDRVWARNQVWAALKLLQPSPHIKLEEQLPEIKITVKTLLDYAIQTRLIDDTAHECDRFEAMLMGIVTPRPSEIIRQFQEQYQVAPQAATARLFHLSTANRYVHLDRAARNKFWTTETASGNLQVTINLSKPEKDPKDIARMRTMGIQEQDALHQYPSCMLCSENVGYAGRADYPSRQNLRTVPLELCGEKWHFQYSPYVYYDEHSIVFADQHTPMKMTSDTLNRLLDFTVQFPHYFIGSNADLPIVGGSILNHDHYQAGQYQFPMNSAKADAVYRHENYTNVKVERLCWPMSVIRLTSARREALMDLASRLMTQWQSWQDESCEILPYSKTGNQTFAHNTITPICRRVGDDFQLDLVLRNNRITKLRPHGLFHPKESLHHIKKENIGLIEVMGLAILPGRLDKALQTIAEAIAHSDLQQWERWQGEHPMVQHREWTKSLVGRWMQQPQSGELSEWLKHQVGQLFHEVLSDCAVFNREVEGITGFNRFINTLGCLETEE